MRNNKISLHKKIRSKLDELREKMVPILKWRFLSDEICKKMKRDNILDPKFESLVSTINDHSVKENECFILYMIYLYIKCLLKNSRFYPDTTLRLLLFCKQHNSKKHSNSEQEP